MRRLLFIFVALLGFAAVPADAGDPVFGFDPGDPTMNEAIRDARSTLPVFYDRMAKTDLEEEVMLLKVAMPYGQNNHEHIWVAVLRKTGTQFDGYFSNAPVHINYAQYDPITFSENMVSDWMYFENGKIHGSYTTRVILPQLSQAEQASLRAQLAPLP